MRYCIQFDNRNKHINDVDEIIIAWHGTDFRVRDFIEAHPEQRTILYISRDYINQNFIKAYAALAKEIPQDGHQWRLCFELAPFQYYLDIKSNTDIWENELNEAGAKWFYSRAPHNWDEFGDWIKRGVADIYISNDMAFDIARCVDATEALDIQIRLIPNRAQHFMWRNKDITTFFIRPEAVPFYEEYPNIIFEFFEHPEIALTRTAVLYEIYESHEWRGPLNRIIMGLDVSTSGQYFTTSFDKVRMRCKKRCEKGGICHLCQTNLDLANGFAEMDKS